MYMRDLCWLLLHLPEKVFESVVPVLLVAALILVVAQPWIQKWVGRRSVGPGHHPAPLSGPRIATMVIATFAVGVYGGYFTAAQGILLMGVLGVVVPDHLQRMNAAKNLLSLVVNIVAGVVYSLVAFDRIDWAVAVR